MISHFYQFRNYYFFAESLIHLSFKIIHSLYWYRVVEIVAQMQHTALYYLFNIHECEIVSIVYTLFLNIYVENTPK